MVVVRNRTVIVRKSEGIVPDYSSFCDLVEKGAFGDAKLVQQVVKSGDEFHVSFGTPEITLNVAKSYKRNTELGLFFVDHVEERRSYLKLLDLPFELGSEAIIKVFSAYGKVCEVIRDKFPGRSFYNGLRTVPIYLRDDVELPEKIEIDGFTARVVNTSVINCSFCKKNGHQRRGCPDLKCNNCEEIGHFANRCPLAFCTLCNMKGHWTKQCKVGLRPGVELKKKNSSKGKAPAKDGAPSYAKAAASSVTVNTAPVTTAPNEPVLGPGPGVPSTSTFLDTNARKKPRTFVPSKDDVFVAGEALNPRQRPQAPLPTSNRFNVPGFHDEPEDYVDDHGPEDMDQGQSSFDISGNVST